MKKYIRETREWDRISSIKCDKCNKECIEKYSHSQEGTSFYMNFEYGSKFDTETWEYDLCDDCSLDLKTWINNG